MDTMGEYNKWKVAKCGHGQLCMTSANGSLGVDKKSGKQNRLAAKLTTGYEDWDNSLEVMCDDCEMLDHCNIINRFMGGQQIQDMGKLMADRMGKVFFGYNYGRSYHEWFDWKIKICH